ncbi:hypothetical protein [uncultured Tateyamaria sp.]|uniref:hypothetical protein n=1 Tax=uncultured Tateyamaria sp. TaxID=455651 RepID=UPI00262DD98B|nr:hypothetical protein [uncultured Tateyamaria sp.]
MQDVQSIFQQVKAFRNWRKQQRRRISRYHELQTAEHDWSVREEIEGPNTTLSYGPYSFQMSVLNGVSELPGLRDHTALALAGVSMSINAQLTYDGPVSKGMARQIDELSNAYRLWTIDGLAPLRLSLSNVVDDEHPRNDIAQTGVICLSGGLDSMYAALQAKEDGDVHHALLVAGLDYDSSTAPGFVELRARVENIARAFGFEMLFVNSSIRDNKYVWSQMHGLNLGACLNLFSDQFKFGVIAQDNTTVQNLHRHPWGNHIALDGLMSTERFGIRTYGQNADRVEKLRRILEWNEDVVRHLSVCFSDRSTGGNCGHCPKCCRLRATFEALGVSDNGLFETYPDLATCFREMKVPRKIAAIRGMMCRTSEVAIALQDGATRDAVVGLENRLREAFVAATE